MRRQWPEFECATMWSAPIGRRGDGAFANWFPSRSRTPKRRRASLAAGLQIFCNGCRWHPRGNHWASFLGSPEL